MTSLMKRRIALEQDRAFGAVGIVASGGFVLVMSVLIATGGAALWTNWFTVGIWIAIGIGSTWMFLNARRKLRAFDEENPPQY